MSLNAYIRYDHTGRIVPGGPIVSRNKPAVGNWQIVTPATGVSVTLSGKLKAFVKINEKAGGYVAGSLFLGNSKPATGRWIEVNATYSPITEEGFFLTTENGELLITESGNNLVISPVALFLSTEEYNQLITEDNNNITI